MPFFWRLMNFCAALVHPYHRGVFRSLKRTKTRRNKSVVFFVTSGGSWNRSAFGLLTNGIHSAKGWGWLLGG